MSWHPVATTSNGMTVYADLISSPAAAQVSRQPHLLALAKELLEPLKLKGETVFLEKDMGRVIGTTDVVATAEKDAIFYAQLLKSDVFVRFVKNRRLESTSYIAFELRRTDAATYQLWSMNLGHKIPIVPGEEGHNDDSRSFWDNHAVVWGNWPVKAQSITKECPW